MGASAAYGILTIQFNDYYSELQHLPFRLLAENKVISTESVLAFQWDAQGIFERDILSIH